MNKDDLKSYNIISKKQLKEVVQETVHETFKTLGVNVNDPYRMQSNFIFLDRLRRRFDEVSRLVGNAILYAIGITILALLVWGFDNWKSH